jgi:hypothetical protein
MGTYPQVPLAHRLERCHLLDAVRIEVLQLKPVLIEDLPDEPPGGDGAATLAEGRTRRCTPWVGAAQTLPRAPSTPRRQ